MPIGDALPWEEYEHFVCECKNDMFTSVTSVGFIVSKQRLNPIDPPTERRRKLSIGDNIGTTAAIVPPVPVRIQCTLCHWVYEYSPGTKGFIRIYPKPSVAQPLPLEPATK